MKNYKDIGIYDFSDYAEEITGNALFKINGGAEVENSDKGVAGAKPGDTITRKNGDVIVLKQIGFIHIMILLVNCAQCTLYIIQDHLPNLFLM